MRRRASLVRVVPLCLVLSAAAAFAEEAPDRAKAVTEGEHLIAIPQHPLDDSARANEEKAQLKPSGDSDAELDKALGLAKAQPSATAAPEQESEGLGWQLFKTLLMLGVVVGLIYLALNFGLRRLMGLRGSSQFGKGNVVSVVERITLEPKRSIYVLHAAGEYLLVGVGDSGMSLISKLDNDAVEEIQRAKGTAQMQLSPFLQKLLTRKGGPPPQA